MDYQFTTHHVDPQSIISIRTRRYLNGLGDRLASTEYETEIEMPIVPSVVVAPT